MTVVVPGSFSSTRASRSDTSSLSPFGGEVGERERTRRRSSSVMSPCPLGLLRYAAMIMPATASRPAISSQGEPSFVESSADSVPNRATSAKVRSPALADGVRSRSNPISRPMARLVRNCGKASMPLFCRRTVSIALPLYVLPVTNDQLQALRAIVFIDTQTVHGMYLFGQHLVVSEQYRLDRVPGHNQRLGERCLLA